MNESMSRNAARELSVRLIYELDFSKHDMDRFLENNLSQERFSSLAEEDALYKLQPADDQRDYIKRLVAGVDKHAPELDSYIQKYAIGWDFARISRLSTAIMRVAMFEILYMPDVPGASSIDSAVRLAKKYETEQTAAFINGILGSFIRQEAEG